MWWMEQIKLHEQLDMVRREKWEGEQEVPTQPKNEPDEPDIKCPLGSTSVKIWSISAAK